MSNLAISAFQCVELFNQARVARVYARSFAAAARQCFLQLFDVLANVGKAAVSRAGQ